MAFELAVELLVGFVGLPLVFDQLLRRGHRALLFPGLWAFGGLALSALLGDPGFRREQLLAVPWHHPFVPTLVLRSVVLIGLLAYVGRRLSGSTFLELPRRRPALFALIAVFYPIVSVLPQGIVWRVLFVHRYAALFGQGLPLWLVAAAAFAWAHLVFRNLIAIALTAVGGALFLHTYLVTGSMVLSDLEHAAYGVSVFAFGLGRYLYLGAARPSL
jgi:hypothetical protein